ncbi:MAG: hypothetical protein HQM09_11935 [Candidatus Riflebacteria bacterium]|nr:hypothetical protein [Candidatus Riflebacteria bacterium]
MNPLISHTRNPSFPVAVMIGFFCLLCVVMAGKVYFVDRELAARRLTSVEARLAAETALHAGIIQVRKSIAESGGLHPSFRANVLPTTWRRLGQLTDGVFRLVEMRDLPGIDDPQTRLIDESELFRVGGEGKSGGYTFRSWGIAGVIPIVKKFAVFNSLNELYYGSPIQPWVREAESLDGFRKTNSTFFEDGRLDTMGVSNDPEMLVKMFRLQGTDSFKLPDNKAPFKGNYGSLFYTRGGESPCWGPLYCRTPVIVDDHLFHGPVQTASYLFRRGTSQARIQQKDGPVYALPSSRRIQIACDHLEGDPPGVFTDIDTFPKTSYLAPWRPDLNVLRAYAKKEGLYIDENGKGILRGEPTKSEYHFTPSKLYSEAYLTPNSPHMIQDEITDGTITLSTASRFDGRNNIGTAELNGVQVIFAETSISLRGEVGGDLMIVTPRHILLTGSTNNEHPFNLFLVAGDGISLDTHDLEGFLKENSAGQDMVAAARQWSINAVLYKPGAGWYGNWSRLLSGTDIPVPEGIGNGGRVSVTIRGACLEGNLSRWLEHAAPEGIKIEWNPNAVDRLPFQPVSVNLFRTRVVPVF